LPRFRPVVPFAPFAPASPRGMAMLGLIAGPVLLARFVAILFGVFEPGSVLGSLMVVPEFLWELSLGIWLTVRGFNPSVIASEKFRLRPAQA
jgi:hypothetical protein